MQFDQQEFKDIQSLISGATVQGIQAAARFVSLYDKLAKAAAEEPQTDGNDSKSGSEPSSNSNR